MTNPPLYAAYTYEGHTVAMCLLEYEEGKTCYYRHAGCWCLGYEIKDGKVLGTLTAESPEGVKAERGYNHLYGVELKEITYEEWAEGNKGFIGEDTLPIETGPIKVFSFTRD